MGAFFVEYCIIITIYATCFIGIISSEGKLPSFGGAGGGLEFNINFTTVNSTICYSFKVQ